MCTVPQKKLCQRPNPNPDPSPNLTLFVFEEWLIRLMAHHLYVARTVKMNLSVKLGALFTLTLALVSVEALVPNLQRPLQLLSNSRAVVVTKGWGDPNWNWGSAIGEAHDLAGPLRQRLGTPDARIAWLREVLKDTTTISWDEIKLALALEWQRAEREGRAGGPDGFARVMDKMVAAEYENSAEGEEWGSSGEEPLSRLAMDMWERLELLVRLSFRFDETPPAKSNTPQIFSFLIVTLGHRSLTRRDTCERVVISPRGRTSQYATSLKLSGHQLCLDKCVRECV